jgi:small nuclear ribonucleoprotein (snRNP)-like protein
MNAIIYNALKSAATDIEFSSKDEFMTALLARLFPEFSDSSTEKMVHVKETKAKKVRGKVVSQDGDMKPVSQNIEKITPTQAKKMKTIGEEMKTEIDKKALLEYLNALSTDDYTAKKFDEHVRSFAAPSHVAAAPQDVSEFEFEGKMYVVSSDNRVFETTETGEVSVFAGNIGIGKFKNVKLTE